MFLSCFFFFFSSLNCPLSRVYFEVLISPRAKHCTGTAKRGFCGDTRPRQHHRPLFIIGSTSNKTTQLTTIDRQQPYPAAIRHLPWLPATIPLLYDFFLTSSLYHQSTRGSAHPSTFNRRLASNLVLYPPGSTHAPRPTTPPDLPSANAPSCIASRLPVVWERESLIPAAPVRPSPSLLPLPSVAHR